MQLKDFKLSVPRGKGDFTILENDELIFNKGIFIVKGTIFEILADIKFGTSNLVFKGRVGNGRVDFISEESKIKLQDFGKIAGLDIQGRGTGIVTVSGPFKDVNINLATSLKDSSFEEYFFDRSSMDVTISLAREKVILNSISGKLPNTLYFLSGDYNWSNNRINLNVNTPHSTFEDIKKMYKPLVDVLPWVPESLGGLVSNNFTVGGEVDLKKLRVKGKFKAQNLSFLTESFSDLELNFNMNKSKLDLTNLKLRKETGVLSGGYSYNINNDHYSFDFKLNNGRVSELNLAKRFFSSLRGGLSGSISGSKTKKIKIKSKLKLTDTFVLNKRMPSSKLEVDYSDNLVFYDLSYFGESATLKGKINFDEPQNSKKNLSSLKGKLDVPDLKLILVSILGEHIANTSFKGSINTTIDSKFNYNNLQELDLDATILNLKLSKDNARVENLQPGYFKITKGKIDKWKFDTQGERGLISSQGSGNFSKKYNVKTLVDIDSTFVELISPKILRVSGTIRNEINFSEKYELGFSFTSVTDDFDFSYDGMPLTLQKSKARLSFDGRRLLVQEFKSQVGSGSLLASGEVIVKFPFPSININYSLDNAKFNFIDKSNFYLNGNGLFLGEKIPYDLSGELTLENGDINLEFDELSKAGGFTIGGEKYLPKRVSINQLKLIDSNITLSTKGPLLFKNSIVNVSFKGDINVTDNIFNPKIGGKMISIPGLSRFFFKNNEFNISKGEVYFTDINGVLNPELDFLANSAIDDYTITMRVNGTSKDFKVGLSSDPFLAQNDILSLLAFGYTDEQTKNLSGEVRSEVSSVGVGTLLFESFKINEALKSEFGIKLNVGTELDDSQQSLLDGTSSGSGSSTVGRVRSATKVEVQKRLNDAMGLSVSSTVGGNIGQRQSMNLNYKINDTVSLEGVYENRTGDQIQGDIIDNSIGVDVKFRWSTK
jgi:translocation and assembly module TamB